MAYPPLTETDVVNRALTLIKAPCISSLDDDSKTACAAKLAYQMIVAEVAQMHLWNSLEKSVCLPCDPECPKFGWTRSYTLPNDYARVVSVREVNYKFKEDRFNIACGKIYVNEDCSGWKPWKKRKKPKPGEEAIPWGGKDEVDEWDGNDGPADLYEETNSFDELPLTYISNCKPPHEWDALLTSAIVYKLAAELAVPMNATAETASSMASQAYEKLAEARRVDVQEDGSGENNVFERTINRSALVRMRRRRF